MGQQTSNAYNYPQNNLQSPMPGPQDTVDTIVVPVANMTGLDTVQDVQQGTVHSSDRELELDDRMKARVKKVNEKRDREDGTYRQAKRKSAASSEYSTPKRQRQTMSRASGSATSPTTNETKLFEDCEDAEKDRRTSIIRTIESIWGSRYQSWPVYEFSPARLIKPSNTNTRGKGHRHKEEPRNWSVELLEAVCNLAKVAQHRRDETRQVLRDFIRGSVAAPHVEKTIDPVIVSAVTSKLSEISVEDEAADGLSRSPTFAASACYENDDDLDERAQIEAGEVQGEIVPAIDDRHDSPQQDDPQYHDQSLAPAFSGRSDDDLAFIEDLVYNTSPEYCRKFGEMFDDVVKEKQRHDAAREERSKRWRAKIWSQE